MKRVVLLAVFVLIVQSAFGCTARGDKNGSDVRDGSAVSVASEDESDDSEGLKKDNDTVEGRAAISDSDYEIKDSAVEGNQGFYEIDCNNGWNKNVWIVSLFIVRENVGILYEVNDGGGTGILIVDPFGNSVVADIEFTEDMYLYSDIIVSDDGRLAIYDPVSFRLKLFDDNYELEASCELGEKDTYRVVFSHDLKRAYYYDRQSCRMMCQNVEDGSKTAVFEEENASEYEYLALDGIIEDDYLLYNYCTYETGDTVFEIRRISDGEVVYNSSESLFIVDSLDDTYALKCNIDGCDELIYGKNGEEPKILGLSSLKEYGYTECDDILSSAVSWYKINNGNGIGLAFNDYSFETGCIQHHGEFRLDADEFMHNCTAKSCSGDYVVFSMTDGMTARLFLWDLLDEGSVSDDTECYAYSFDELANGDDIEELRKRAGAVGEKYGVEIYIGDDIENCTKSGNDYVCIENPIRIGQALKIIDEELALYPAGMLAQLDDEVGGILKIYLADDIYGTEEYSLTASAGIQNTMYNDTFMVLDITDVYSLKRTIHHELYHAIENHIINEEVYFDLDEWMSLNPDDFDYDYDYSANEVNYDYSYVAGGDNGVYFIDIYAKSFPHEDRARIIEYAIMDEVDDMGIFENEHIRNKLSYICERIRLGFDTTGWPEVTLWEKPLQ